MLPDYRRNNLLGVFLKVQCRDKRVVKELTGIKIGKVVDFKAKVMEKVCQGKLFLPRQIF
jgi:hypothetical protein